MFLLISCGGLTEAEIEVQAKERFLRRAAQLRIEKMQECKQEIARKAQISVDSMIRSLDINPLNETLYKPPIPERPAFVEVDSSVFISKHSVKPIPK